MFNENRFDIDKCVEPHREKWVIQHRSRKRNKTPQKRAQRCRKERFLDFGESLKVVFRVEKAEVYCLCGEKSGCYNTHWRRKSGCYNTVPAFAKPPTPAVETLDTPLDNEGSFDLNQGVSL